jgi:DNA-binding transcriptional ArsR family regulator
MIRSRRKPQLVASPAQRKALSSPVRLEILGCFMPSDGLTIADLAERMGRPATALYYHVRILEEVGVLRQVGERPGTKRAEAIYDLVADRVAYAGHNSSPAARKEAVKAMSLSFRMAERELDAALASAAERPKDPERQFFASRAHCRTRKSTLAKVNRLLSEIGELLAEETRREAYPDDASEFFSLTIALLPLLGREENNDGEPDEH